MSRETTQRNKVLVNLFDVDGCLYHKYAKGPFGRIPSDPKENLIKGNEKLFDELHKNIIQAQYDRVVFAYGTNRQDYSIDEGKWKHGGSCVPLLPLVQQHFKNLISKSKTSKQTAIFADPFMMGDIFAKEASDKDIAPGRTYDYISERVKPTELPHETQNDDSSESLQKFRAKLDDSKISLIYAQVHRAALLNPGADVTINFFDDQPGILDKLHEFLVKIKNYCPAMSLYV